MESDIVARLRAVLHNDRSVELMNRDAADEIERLHRDYSCICKLMRRMMAERDEARRMWCEEAFCHRFNESRFNERLGPSPISNARQIAHNMKWDCFKEEP